MDPRYAKTIPDSADETAPGTAISLSGERYAATELLGEGGMGEVHLVRDAHVGRDVAMKIVKPDMDTVVRERRFLKEARVQAQLEHPNIVPVYDVGRDDSGRAFFTMKRVRGVTLDVILQKLLFNDSRTGKEYTRHRLLTAFAQVCLTIDFAHARGVLHRDLKPGNIMFGDFGEVYVLDWGLAKVGSHDSRDAPLNVELEGPTSANSIIGTPGYMSPEQALGLKLDPRADVFSLGAILFEILTAEPMVGDPAEVFRFVKNPASLERRPSTRAPERDIPAELDAICERATRANPDERFASARELHDAIEAFMSGDRDLALRNKLAAEHLEKARAATERAVALREVGRAIALAPEEPDALALLVKLLTDPPSVPPPEVEAQLVDQGLARLRKVAPRMAVVVPLLWLTCFPLFAFFAGVHHPAQAAVVPLAWSLASVAMYIDIKRGMQQRIILTPFTIFLASAVTTVLSGPFMIVPAIVATTSQALALATRKVRRPAIMFFGALALLVPTFLAWSGLHPIYHFEGFALTIDGALDYSGPSMYIGVTLVHFFCIALAFGFAARYRDALDAAVLKNLLHAWQLSKLTGAKATDPG